ncbi:ABC transporter permease [Poseidonibacter ostreae]|jgi:putative ABC transport system permease protein|uniref:FtsX-like permease family protein n=1 Tax=Poseidonibacter ostreae TaxID=2654171 RepID=A0A6L4WQU9_9BACT|nr:FtsX-like permease family protein [Poseidonibacter ostreae]KAB7885324.1 FtsX-like permease family protein [Poseidonibacter ostreae]KAB7886590.1 FtsX-like permease family protein [Poseidonibacter ostreae]KAB7889424.1 FtsX-like permease family protein [Poseidonibacter ostreae]
MLVLELVYKALARSKSFSLIFIFNFCLAIASLSYLQFFKGSMESSLDTKAKILLGSDLVVSSRFPINDKQIDDIKSKLPEIKSFSKGISTISMISSDKRARLMEVVKLNEGFPYYGGLVFKDKSVYPKGEAMPASNEVWVYQEVLDLLNLKLQDKVKIGKVNFIIKKVIEEDSLKAISFSGFMPKIYISKEGLDKTELLQFGSTARYKLNYLFKDNFENDKLEEIENTLEKSIDQDLRALSPNDGRDRLLRVLNFVTNFLSLVSLISFFLGLVGLIYLYSGFLKKHQKDITILNDLGLSKKNLSLTYLLHLFVLVTTSTIIVFTLMGASASFLAPIIEKLIDFKFDLNLDYTFFLKSSLVLLLLSLSIGLPLILPLLQRTKRPFYKVVLGFIPFIILLLVISHFVTPNKFVGLYFATAILAIIALFFAIGSVVLKKFDFVGHLDNLSLSLALKNIVRQRRTSLTLFTAILLCTTFFSLIPQIGSSLSAALTQSIDDRPRFFVVDAKEEQLKDIQTQVNSMGAKLENIAPMIRGRIIKVNNMDFTKHSQKNANKELKAEQSELKNRAVNLSYRNTLKQSEKIVEGREFSGIYDSADFSKPIEVSVEKNYASRRGIKLNDTLVFDILGLELQAVVVNIRTVKWTEFVPNFFLILQEGALSDAPKTILATISTGDYDATQMLIKLSDLFPTLTVIDVKNLFETFAVLVKNVTNITDKMSIYSIIIGLLMSFIIIQYQMNLQKNNILRLKMIGVKNKAIRNSFLIEFGLITFAASSFGIILGSIGSYVISNILFDSYWDFRPDVLLVYFFFIPILTILIVSFFTSKMIHQKENVLFGE